MNVKFTDLYKEYLVIKRNIDKSIFNVIKTSAFIRGDFVKKFENNFRKKIKSKYCLTCNNGTDALMLSMIALGIKKNDQVITTSHSWISSSASITNAGGKVVFSDVKKNSFNINPQDIKKKLIKKL